tara:strand:+ start:919 stop:1257 length:339 start_codon:yes stop_codon:yes gene_type:complete
MKFDKLYLPLSMAKDFRFQLSKPVNKKIGDLSYEHGKTRPDYLRPFIKEIISKFPKEIQDCKEEYQLNNVKMTNVSDDDYEKLVNIARYLRIGVHTLIKIQVYNLTHLEAEQ